MQLSETALCFWQTFVPPVFMFNEVATSGLFRKDFKTFPH